MHANRAALASCFSVAPMLDWTDKHCRYFFRLLSKNALLYTEMVTTGAVLYGDKHRHLAFDPVEGPLALQLGGSDPEALAQCAQLAEAYGYDEINLNVGCPSDRVQSGRFGACLMAEPALVAECVAAMKAVVSLPVTVKSRIGIDAQDSYEALHHFIHTIQSAGCDRVIIHARKAWLKGLSPKENRDIPPLQYQTVYDIKKDFPALPVIINGGITCMDQTRMHLTHVDGVMLGREIYHNPYFLAAVDQAFFASSLPCPTREEVIEKLTDYLSAQYAQGVAVKQMTRHVLGLFHGMPLGKQWRRYLSEHAHLPDAKPDILRKAYDQIYARHKG